MTRSFITDPAPSFVYEEELGFSTLVSDFANGVEQRRDTQEQGKKLFRLRYNIQTPEEIDRLWNFYQLCKGKFRSFNFQSKAPSLMPYDQITAWLPLHEGTGTKLDDWNGFIYPTYSVRFVEDKLSYEQFSLKIRKSDIAVIQESPISFTNNYGTLSGTTSFIQCPDGSAGVSFDGSSGQCSLGDAAALDVGTGDFSLAIALYTNSLAAQIGVLSKKTNATSTNKGYHMLISTAGTMTFVFSDGTTQKTLTSAVGAIANQTWKLITVVIDRDGNGQIYINNAASGSAVAIGAALNADNSNNFYMGRAEGVAYGNIRLRNFLFAKKVWTQAERDLLWSTWRGIFQI